MNKLETKIEYSITYSFPGAFLPESILKVVKNPEIPTSIPSDCYSFIIQETEYIENSKTKQRYD